MNTFAVCQKAIEKNGTLGLELALQLAEETDLEELCRVADGLRRQMHSDSFDLCSIVNAKSGHCSENCRFCAQSSHYHTEIEEYPLIEVERALELAKNNEKHGIERFSLVTAGRAASARELDCYGAIYRSLQRETEMSLCASMGMLTPEKARLLKSFGVSRYHCNLEACRIYFPEVCTTHTWEEKVETLKVARAAGLELCSGGIIGMGERLEHRIMLACELQELGVLSIPVNVLSPIPNTPFENLTRISIEEILQTVALFRLINPKAVIRMAGGRNQLGDLQYRIFSAGANGAIVGDYLTTSGNGLSEDLTHIQECGYTFGPLCND